MAQDILLVYPPFHRLFGERKEWMPLGILSLATYLNLNGIKAIAFNADCTISEKQENVLDNNERFKFAKKYQCNLNTDNIIWDEFNKVLQDTNPKVVGFTVLTEALGSVKKLIEITKKYSKNIKIVLGGPHANIAPAFLLTELLCDYVIRGEGELPLLHLMKNICFHNNVEELNTIENLFFSDKQNYKTTISKSKLKLDELPIPKLEYHYDFPKYEKTGKKMNVSTSRGGCAFSCHFCYCSKFSDKVRWKNPYKVFEELKYYVDTYKTKKVFFVDDTFTCNLKFIFELCNLIIYNKLKLKWTCTTHVNQLDYEILLLMKQAGCTSIHVGVESGSERLLEFMNKRAKVSEILKTSKMIKECGIECRTFFLVGLPTETQKDIEMSINLLKEINPNEAILNIYVPIPQTIFYDYIKQNYYDIDSIDWVTFSRDKVPYAKYTEGSHDVINEAINRFFELAEKNNKKTGYTN